MVRTATKLLIRTESDKSLVNDVLKLRNPTIEIQNVFTDNPFTAENVMKIVKDWMTRCPPVNTMFIWEPEDEKLVEVVMNELRNELGAALKSKKINDLVVPMRSGHWLKVEAENDLIRMEIREKDS